MQQQRQRVRWPAPGLEAFAPGAGAAETAKRVCKVVGEWFLGFCGFFAVVAIAKGG